MAIHINDITIETDPYDGRYRVRYKDKAVILERWFFNQLYDNNDHRQMYKFLVQNFFYEKPDMMYDEYFGTDSYELDRETERIKKVKIEHFEGTVAKLHRQSDNGKRQQPSPKQLNKSKLKSTFWGMLIVQDVVDGHE